jgi:beta-galactosidase
VKRDVRVYSNCGEVELVVNGKSQGRRTRDIKKFPACGLVWNIEFSEGKNRIEAIGYERQKKVSSDLLQVNYSTTPSGAPDHLALTSEKLANGRWRVTATMVDKLGLRCLEYNNRISFSLQGNGKLHANLGTPTGSALIEMANGKAQIEFSGVQRSAGCVSASSGTFLASIVPGK